MLIIRFKIDLIFNLAVRRTLPIRLMDFSSLKFTFSRYPDSI